MKGLGFASTAAVAAGSYSVLISRAAKAVDPILALVIVELTAVSIGGLVLCWRICSGTVIVNRIGVLLLIGAGVCVFFVDYFALRAYEAGLPVSVGAPVITAGAVAIAAIAGICIGEGISMLRVGGLLLVVVGVVLLSKS